MVLAHINVVFLCVLRVPFAHFAVKDFQTLYDYIAANA
jgi:hypothetical protein